MAAEESKSPEFPAGTGSNVGASNNEATNEGASWSSQLAAKEDELRQTEQLLNVLEKRFLDAKQQMSDLSEQRDASQRDVNELRASSSLRRRSLDWWREVPPAFVGPVEL